MVNDAAPKERQRERDLELADGLLEKYPTVLKGIKDAFKRVQQLDWDLADHPAPRAGLSPGIKRIFRHSSNVRRSAPQMISTRSEGKSAWAYGEA